MNLKNNLNTNEFYFKSMGRNFYHEIHNEPERESDALRVDIFNNSVNTMGFIVNEEERNRRSLKIRVCNEVIFNDYNAYSS